VFQYTTPCNIFLTFTYRMKKILQNIFYAFPIQLFILHFRKYQVLLIFWVALFSIVNSSFMKSFGGDALFFAPEYLGNVNILSALSVGVAMGVFIMSWNITTFILHSKRFKFLAATSKPFLKYCLNNAVLPLIFVIFYMAKLVQFDAINELMSTGSVTAMLVGLLLGAILLFVLSFLYFFGAEKTIVRSIAPMVGNPQQFNELYDPAKNPQADGFGMKVTYFLSGRFRLRKARNVSHYSKDFLDMIFKRHHFAAIISIVLAFMFLAVVGFFLDNKFFELPAAASIFVFFAAATAVIGALTYFLQSWSLLFVIILIIFLNVLYVNDVIDPRNKAYGLNYTNKTERPQYNKQALQALCTLQKMVADKNNMLSILKKWKQRQKTEKPVMIFINVSGGGLRSATFVMNTLQHLDSATNGKLMQQTFLITGASGGMLAASYYRELYRQKLKGQSINLANTQYTNNIAQDLLNPVFSSMIARDVFAPAQKFTVGNYKYVKDRGYAFEKRLGVNSAGLLNTQLKEYKAEEYNAAIPLMIFNSTISRDGRAMLIGTQPLSFMMKPRLFATDSASAPDMVDFAALLHKQSPHNLRLLTALRMNATFPYVLPNVWLPTEPIIDVMDAGLHDNFGQETALRFIENFKEWLQQNTSGVLIIQMRDRRMDNFAQPFENTGITDVLTKPATMLQHNWYKLQDYSETNQYNYLHNSLDTLLHKINFVYTPKDEDKGAVLNFHLTAREKRDVMESFYNNENQKAMREVFGWIK
jgi:hypothetical protein